MSATLYMNHRYGVPIIGWEQEIRELNRTDAIEFYNRFYTPSNAILVVAGDVDAAEVRTLAETTYGKVEDRFHAKPRKRPQEPVQLAARRIELDDPRVRQPSMTRLYLAPSYTTATGAEAPALDVLAVVLGGGSTSRLYRALVVEQGVASSAAASYWGSALDPSRFTVYAAPRPDKSLPEVEAAVDAEIRRLIADGVETGELERAKTRLVADTIYDRDNQASLARTFGAALTTGETVESVKTWPDRIKNVTAEDVRAAARAVLDIRHSVTGYLKTSPAGDHP
jgi:zinc protease